jgi:hypothetical protein
MLQNSVSEGASAQILFRLLAERNGWECVASTPEELKYQRWNLRIAKDDESYKVDVKARKRVSRSDATRQDTWMWIELRNVYGGDGWLYGGADLIAFQITTKFYIVHRSKLARLVNKIVSVNEEPVIRPEDAQYHPYSRAGRDDLLTQIHLNDILPIVWNVWDERENVLRRAWRRIKRFFGGGKDS